jgi:hypothetical protein
MGWDGAPRPVAARGSEHYHTVWEASTRKDDVPFADVHDRIPVIDGNASRKRRACDCAPSSAARAYVIAIILLSDFRRDVGRFSVCHWLCQCSAGRSSRTASTHEDPARLEIALAEPVAHGNRPTIAPSSWFSRSSAMAICDSRNKVLLSIRCRQGEQGDDHGNEDQVVGHFRLPLHDAPPGRKWGSVHFGNQCATRKKPRVGSHVRPARTSKSHPMNVPGIPANRFEE